MPAADAKKLKQTEAKPRGAGGREIAPAGLDVMLGLPREIAIGGKKYEFHPFTLGNAGKAGALLSQMPRLLVYHLAMTSELAGEGAPAFVEQDYEALARYVDMLNRSNKPAAEAGAPPAERPETSAEAARELLYEVLATLDEETTTAMGALIALALSSEEKTVEGDAVCAGMTTAQAMHALRVVFHLNPHLKRF